MKPQTTGRGPGGILPPESLCIALDTADIEEARNLVRLLASRVGWFKVGLTLFTRWGREAVEVVRSSGRRVFLDLKLHDTPAQVAGAVVSAAQMGAEIVTVHASGGAAMIEAAARARGPGMRVVAVTVLTSLGGEGFSAVWPDEAPRAVVARLTALARRCGADGVVLSAQEVAAVRKVVGPDFFLVVPGLRGRGDAAGDQARIGTPRQAFQDGADLLVVGRIVTAAKDPVAALEGVLAED